MKRLVATLILAVLLILGAFASLGPAAAQTGYNTACYGEQGGAKHVAASGCEYEFQSGATLDIQAGASVNFGGLYPLYSASDAQQIVCGTTTFTGATTIDVTALSTVTYVLASQVTAPAATGAFLHVSDPTTTTITLTSLEGDYTAGTTPVEVHYCAIGDQ